MNGPQTSLSTSSRRLLHGLAITLLVLLLLTAFVSGVVATSNQPNPNTTATATLTPTITSTPATSSADLLIDQYVYTWPDTTVPIGVNIGDRFSVTIRNAGTSDAFGFWAGLYLSPDSTINTADTLLPNSAQYISSLAAGQSMALVFPTNVQIPSATSPGQAYLGLFVDKTNLVPESNETNNTSAISVTLVNVTPTPSPTATAIPTATPAPTATPSPTVQPMPDLVIYKGLDGVATTGGTTLYRIDFHNQGTADAHNVRVTDTLPAGMAFITATLDASGASVPLNPNSVAGNQVSWNIGAVPLSSAQTILMLTTLDATIASGDTITNHVEIGSPDPEPDTYNNVFDFSTTISVPNIKGTVLDPMGNPVGLAEIVASNALATYMAGHTWSRFDGSFALGGLPAGTYHVQVTSPAGSTLPDARPFTVTLPAASTLVDVGNIYLGPPQIAGVVTLPDGATTLASAYVVADSIDGTPHTVVTADNVGYFEFWGLLPGTYRIQAYPPPGNTSYTPSLPNWVHLNEATYHHDMGFIPVTSPNVTGEVQDPAGNLVADAIVSLFGPDGSLSLSTTTGPQGDFAFGGVPAGSYQLLAKPPAGSPFAASVVMPISTYLATTGSYTLYLTNPSITGQVTDPTIQTGIAGADTLLHDPTWQKMTVASTDSNGFFKLGGLSDGTYTLEAFPPGDMANYAPSKPMDVAMVSGTITDVGEVPLSWTMVEGKVLEPAGIPHHDAHVHVQAGLNAPNNAWDVQTNWAGQFRLGNLNAGTSYWAQAQPRNYGQGLADSDPVPFSTSSQTVPTITLILHRANLVGQVVDDKGDPLAATPVLLYHDTNTVSPTVAGPALAVQTVVSPTERWIGTDNNGQFAFGALSAGTYWVQAFPPPDRADLFRSDPLQVQIVQGTVNYLAAPLVLQAAGKQLTVTVQRTDSSAVTNGLVHANQRGSTLEVSAIAGSDGAYHLGLAGGEWEVSVEPAVATANWIYTDPPQIVTFDKSNLPESKTITLTVMTVDAHVTGLVLNPDDTVPTYGSVYVDVRGDDGVGNGQMVNGDGHFDVAVPAGTYNVSIYVLNGDLYAPALPPVRVTSGDVADLGTIHLQQKTAHITGRVTRADTGNGIAGLAVKAGTLSGNQAQTTTDAGGYYTLTVSTGVWYVGVDVPPDVSLLGEIPIRRVKVKTPGETVSGVDFALMPAPATVQGSVVNEFGQRLPDVDAWVYARDANSATDDIIGGAAVSKGQFTFQLPAGSYQIGLYLPPGSPYVADPEQSVTLGTGDVATMTLTVRAADALIIGQFDLGMSALTQIAPQTQDVLGYVYASGGDGQDWHSAPIHADGSFSLTVAAGTWRVSYELVTDDYVAPAQQHFRVNVQAGETYDLGTIPLLRVDSEIRGVVQKPSMAPYPGATVWAIRQADGRQIRFTAEASDPDGSFVLRVPAGVYRVGATAPDGSGFHAPPIQTVATNPQTPANITLRFWTASARLDGVVGFPSTGGIVGVEGAYLWGWSEEGAHVEGTSKADGTYRLWLSPGTWHLGAVYQEENRTVFRSDEAVLAVTRSQILTHDFALHPAGTLPSGRTVSFNANEVQVIHLDDGTEVRIPAGALATSGRVWVVIAPTVNDVPHTWAAKPLTFGYSLQAFDDSGREITGNFNKKVLISFPYNESDLPAGVSEENIVPLYYSTTTNSWTPVDSYVLDTRNNRVTAEITHFSMWMDSMWMDSMWMDGGGVQFLPLIVRGG